MPFFSFFFYVKYLWIHFFSGHAFKKIKLEEKIINSDEKIKPDEKIKLEPVSPKKEDIIGKSNLWFKFSPQDGVHLSINWTCIFSRKVAPSTKAVRSVQDRCFSKVNSVQNRIKHAGWKISKATLTFFG